MKSLIFATAFLIFSTTPAGAWEALPEQAPAPKDNPTTEKKVELGVFRSALFRDWHRFLLFLPQRDGRG